MKRIVFLVAAICMVLLSACGRQDDRYPLDAGRIEADTRYLCEVIGPRPTGTEKEREGCDWLEEQLEEIGFSYDEGTLVRTEFEGFPGMYSENLTAICNKGSDGPILCVMAHYDTVENCPGARDNTSAVATVLEIARYLGVEHPELDCEIRMLMLGSEENGYHGARAYVERLTQEEIDRHLAAFNLENSAAIPGKGAVLMFGTQGGMVDGVYQEGNFLEPMENLVTRTVSRSYKELYRGEQPPSFHMGGSDHLMFHKAGIEAANVCWKYLREDGGPRLPEQYHQPTDTVDGMDFSGAVLIGRCVLDSMYRLAGEQVGV